MKIVNILSKIHEYKGKQELYLTKHEQSLEKLTDLAIIQSTDSSNKIEGIFTSDTRLKQIVEKKIEPRNRNEEEIAGYRDVLKLVHESYKHIDITPNNILNLHNRLYSYSNMSFKGKWKNGDNLITERDTSGNEYIRFRPASAFEIPELVKKLCNEYNQSINKGKIGPLILIPCFILDFLCIHPFNDGNGRLSRILTLLLLYRSHSFKF